MGGAQVASAEGRVAGLAAAIQLVSLDSTAPDAGYGKFLNWNY